MTGLTLTDLPPELMALIADFVHDFDDLANMSMACHRTRIGVLLTRQWIIVKEIVAATGPNNSSKQRQLLYDRRQCSIFACERGLLRTLRELHLTRTEVMSHPYRNLSSGLVARCAAAPDPLALSVCRYLHTTFALTPEDLSIGHHSNSALTLSVWNGRHEMFKYLHAEVGMTIPRDLLNAACNKGHLDILKYMHTAVGFTADDVRQLGMKPLLLAAGGGHGDCVAYLRSAFGCQKEDFVEGVAVGPEYEKLVEEVFGATYPPLYSPACT
eukprot:TRINITY_DN11142_c0_g1_i1.p1 TRINITY_DN11142_c0_g1~~TRINITY_DN11142_c0_g1_i1.p1  ORF type:complete len:270 (+),score=32.85 TRINITY_DN11142_c0_g1_i1:243-1052(+)